MTLHIENKITNRAEIRVILGGGGERKMGPILPFCKNLPLTTPLTKKIYQLANQNPLAQLWAYHIEIMSS